MIPSQLGEDRKQAVGIDINQPLGKERKPARPDRGQVREGSGLRTLLAACGIALLAGAGWAAWTAMPPTPVLVADTAPSPSAPTVIGSETNEPAPLSADLSSDGAGHAGQLPHLSGQSGATIATTLGEKGEPLVKITPAERADDGPVLLKAPGRIGQEPRLAHLPDPAVVEETSSGPLPIRGANGERAFDIYARPWSGTRGARVAIVVGGLGLSQTGTQYAIRTLPDEITLAFASNGNSLQRWMLEARRAGHEILIQIPFEPFDYPTNDPGPGTLTVTSGKEKNLADLHKAMARITNYTGVTNFMGGRFLSTPEAMEPIMRDIGKRGIMFLDDGTSSQSLVDRFAKALAIPFAASDMVLDGRQERGYILSKLDDLERTARRNGVAIGVASAFEVSVDAIATWANEAKARGIEIVAVSAIADDPEK